jgi:hypothetical protein
LKGGNGAKIQVVTCDECPFSRPYDDEKKKCTKAGTKMKSEYKKAFYGRVIDVMPSSAIPSWCPFPRELS